MLKQMTLWLCCLMLPVSMAGSSVAAVPGQTLIVALGASSTAGRGVKPAATWPAQLEAMLRARGDDVRIINAGINGDTSAGMLARLDTAVPAGTEIVILQTGTNDAGTAGHDDTIAEIVRRLQARSIRVIPLRTTMLRDLRARYAQADGHHLTPAGYRIVADRLLPLVERQLPR